ncbi:uncharacterized protein STEHIDRAFT_114659 [Stereum hirsutum FP-91666 SS1]|uniref:uncharacterized protein n=1 Tax=Stereum hirsutum (strain FP-91666) TaxID=721885 RepID=UPI0004449FD4|nr:uncharacterized protein STEHIDRAFT_114659 [Stereum hirsutum FP-91666 SS1]EIM81982.1 hypothetical protein STEHIDRAFT_114659 [Stereum hirsutum FP-91666 SS1]
MSGHPIIEEFDDDFDLPLPSRPLPNTGTHGAILEEISSSNSSSNADDDDTDASPGFSRGQGQNVLESWYEAQQSTAGPATGRTAGGAGMGGMGGAGGLGGLGGTGGMGGGVGDMRSEYAKGAEATDISIYKKWTCIYPIYIDAKQPYGTGTRRLPREKSVWWPLSKDIAEAASRLSLSALHEVHKRHPRDWDNPGRVRVQWKMEGRLLNPGIRTKKQLLERISQVIQRLKPDVVPHAPYTYTLTPDLTTTTSPTSTPASKPTPSKSSGKSKATPSSTSKPSSSSTKSVSASQKQKKQQQQKSPSHSLPLPPHPLPHLTTRLSPYSPAQPSGVLIDTIKAGLSAEAEGAAAGTPGTPGVGAAGGQAAGKGKRKVVRVRQ